MQSSIILPNYAATVQSSPEKPCVAEGDWRLSYRDVDLLTDNLAFDLATAGATPGDTVCFVGGAGARRLIFHLAAIKAGYCFCAPILQMGEPYVLELTRLVGPKVIVFENGFEDIARKLDPSAICFNDDMRDHGRPSLRDMPPEAPSFISFTSGSTGIPKGMSRSRAALSYFIERSIALQQLTPDKTVALAGNLWHPSIMSGFAAGASMVCYDAPRLGAAGLADWLIAEKADVTCLYPAIFREIMSTGRRQTTLKRIILIGEPTTRADAEAHAACCKPDATLVNVFGSMEFGYLTRFERRADDPISFEMIPLGLEDYPDVLRVIRDDGEVAADGEIGEIQIVSPHVIDGYLGREEANTGKFGVTENGDKMMMTGDLAYRDHAGIYHSAGRRDGQTKIRGYNVRPPEIEIVIKRQSGVKDATVGPYQTPSGIARLACHYIGDAVPADLKAALAQALPNYMVPSLWMRVDSFPRTATGKVRRIDLPDPFVGQSTRENETLTEVEVKVRAAFEDVLNQTNFGKDDDFFDIGGDSLQAMRLVIILEKRFGRRLPLDSFITSGATVASLSERLTETEGAPLVVLREGLDERTLLLTYSVHGHLGPHMELVHYLDRDLRVIGAHAPQSSSASTSLQTYEQLAEDFLSRVGSGLGEQRRLTIMGFSFGGPLAFEVAQRLRGADGAAPDLVLIDPLLMWRGLRDQAANLRQRVKDGDVAGARQTVRFTLDSLRLTQPRTLSERHSRIFNTYKPTKKHDGRALYISGASGFARRSANMWRGHLPDDTLFHNVQAGHAEIMSDPHAGPLAQVIQRWMGQRR